MSFFSTLNSKPECLHIVSQIWPLRPCCWGLHCLVMSPIHGAPTVRKDLFPFTTHLLPVILTHITALQTSEDSSDACSTCVGTMPIEPSYYQCPTSESGALSEVVERPLDTVLSQRQMPQSPQRLDGITEMYVLCHFPVSLQN